MNGWQTAAVIVAAFSLGWGICSWGAMINREYLLNQIAALRAAQNHDHCRAWIDYFAAKGDIVSEAETILRDRDGGS